MTKKRRVPIPLDTLCLNCSVCDQLLVSGPCPDAAIESSGAMRFEGDRIKGRPLCPECAKPHEIGSLPGSLDPSPWGENAVRALEDQDG